MVSLNLEAKSFGKSTYMTDAMCEQIHACCSNAAKFASDRRFSS